MVRVGITRDMAQLTDLMQRGHERGLDIVPVPILAVTHLPFEWPSEINGNGPDWVVFTSQHGVESFFRRLVQLGRALPKAKRIAAVGVRTAAALAQFGRTADVIPDEAYGDRLFDILLDRHIRESDKVIYARGREVNFEPAPLFAARKLSYYPIICYETAARPVPAELAARFGRNDYLLFTSPSAVRTWHSQFGSPVSHPIAIGRSTAQTMRGLGWSDVTILPATEVSSILEILPWRE